MVAENLKNREYSLNEAQEISKLSSWEWDLITQKHTWSKNFYRIFEINLKEVDQSFDYIKSRIHPDDSATLDHIHLSILTDKKPVDFEMRILFPDGKIKWLLNKIIPILKDGQVVMLKGINIDIKIGRAHV